MIKEGGCYGGVFELIKFLSLFFSVVLLKLSVSMASGELCGKHYISYIKPLSNQKKYWRLKSNKG